PERLLGAALLSSALPRALEALRDEIAGAAARALGLGLRRFAAQLREEDAAVAAITAGFGLGAAFAAFAAPAPAAKAERAPAAAALRHPRPADLDGAIARARAYLAVDPELREAWEVHRWGLFGAPVLTARKFPSAMVLEQLGAAGVPLDGRADALIARYAAEG